MTFTWTFNKKFAGEFANLSEYDQNMILDFADLYENIGLSDFTRYPGKIASSWSGSNMSPEDYHFAKDNDLWHYHVGIPHYETNHPKYKTSEYLLHFQWPNKGKEIKLVDLYSHYTSSKGFYLPPQAYLEE